MNRRFNNPVRTYGRNKINEVIISVPKLVVSTLHNVDNKKCVLLNEKSDEIAKKEINDDSKYYDVFETTFDKLLKNARIPPKAPKTRDTTLNNSANNSSNWNRCAPKWNNKLNVVENNLLQETHKCIVETDQSSNQHKITKIRNNNLKHDDVYVKFVQQCSVKVEKLKVDSCIKPINSEKRCENLISSTPNDRPVRPSTHLMLLSPIPIRYSEKLKNSMTYADTVSISKNNQISLKSKQTNNDLYRKSDVLEKHDSEEKPKSLSNYLTNTSTFSKCNFNQSENLNKKDIDPLIKLDCNSNDNCDQNFIVAKDSVQNVLTNEMKKNDISDKFVLMQKCTISNTQKKKQRLSFSIDANTSHSLFDEADENDKYSIRPSCVILEKLKDPIKITKRRKYSKWDLDMFTILEDGSNSTKVKEKQISSKKANENRQIILPETELSLKNIMEESIINTSIQKPVYLKPGKFWARSLSILNSIQNEFNLDKLSIGKGIVQSCISKYNNDKERQITNETINKLEHELANKKDRTCDSTKLGRLSRRISVRVVPIHKTVKSIEDVPFLEVYGIVPVKSQRFTLLNNPRKSSTCNIQNDDVDGQVIEEHVVSTSKEVILQKCLQKDYIPFSTCFSDSYLDHCRKIGEGVYGEVFLYEEENKKSVIKIIPIEGNEYVNGEPQKKFHEILSEIVIAMELHNLRFNTKYNTDGFVEVKSIKCIKGKYPEKLIELWNSYDEEKHSDNDCPLMFNEDQLYIVLELGHGGQDLEAFVFNTAEEAHILFIQTALALAVAEKAVEFEHRDLHWGNILISPTDESHVHYKLGQKNIELISKNVKVSIIDFTLSRVTYQGCSVFNDLASDPTLFTAQGEYQFEIYRLMKDKVTNNWQKFEPYTNILWLHYTLDKMITAVRYRKRNLKSHKNGIMKLKELKNEILIYSSAFDFVTNCDKIVNLLCIDTKFELTPV
ncbi:Putative serine/threonine-protein kinase haspin like protein [Habropoda laboriosa]|uniref:non-specific serine/threonine protein kinase n=1 Tax=Habropoda laboriosa TaxID=597456 RepID=A0A0L7RFE9_9HYME|nr:Putative serine/threonine-protein kinase haspin like protein [Habropoda laboriosa]